MTTPASTSIQATSTLPKKAADSIPYCRDAGLAHLVGTSQHGVGIQVGQYTMATGGVINFETLGLQKMADSNYAVLTANSSGATPAVSAVGTRTATQCVVTGPTNGNVIDIVLVGKIAGMV